MSFEDLGKRLNRPALGLDLLRIYIGVALVVRGVSFIARPEALLEYMEHSRLWVMPMIVTHYVVAAHVFGGAMLALGLCTRLAAFLQVPVLLGAVFLVHWREGLLAASQSLELSALVLAIVAVISVVGAGELSLDRRLTKSFEERESLRPDLSSGHAHQH
jgi:putative oxidoreductase